MRAPVVIVGGGLSGLYAALLLERKRIDYVILEAREFLGGRLLSKLFNTEAFDLGATWYWPAFQPAVQQLVEELELHHFSQFEDGDMLIQNSHQWQPQRVQGIVSAPPARRLLGGMRALVDALARQLAPGRIALARQVRHISMAHDRVEVNAESPSGEVFTYLADHVLVAAPPRLAAKLISFEPALPASLARDWAHTATWMAPHAKYLAVYPEPFWRRCGLSGGARSFVGPLAEIHDASPPDGQGALFGFVGVPVAIRHRTSEAQLRALCRSQLAKLFGQEAAVPSAEWLKDWSADDFTATEEDRTANHQHSHSSESQPTDGPWAGRISGIASEWSPEFPGYVAGAIDAAQRGVAGLLSQLRAKQALDAA